MVSSGIRVIPWELGPQYYMPPSLLCQLSLLSKWPSFHVHLPMCTTVGRGADTKLWFPNLFLTWLIKEVGSQLLGGRDRSFLVPGGKRDAGKEKAVSGQALEGEARNNPVTGKLEPAASTTVGWLIADTG